MPAGGGGAGRHLVSHRPGDDRGRAGLRPALANSLDAVSARDFALEFLSAAAICATHLSRLAEEIVIWASAQFGFVRLSDRWATGSSIMPQKKNPDAAELIRAKTGRIAGALVALLTVMKGLPLAYSKDMQEDKEQVFDAADTLMLSLAAMAGMIADLTPDRTALRQAAGAGHATATDLADWLVRRLGLPFREAHHVTGRLVAEAEARGCDAGRSAARRDAGGACGHIGGGLRGADGGRLDRIAAKLWRNRARAGARTDRPLEGSPVRLPRLSVPILVAALAGPVGLAGCDSSDTSIGGSVGTDGAAVGARSGAVHGSVGTGGVNAGVSTEVAPGVRVGAGTGGVGASASIGRGPVRVRVGTGGVGLGF
jgi:hypothetical protein